LAIHHIHHERGARFDVREFHEALLRQGAIPMTVLDAHIQRFIEEKKRN